jgi:chromosomal replication initiator protein
LPVKDVPTNDLPLFNTEKTTETVQSHRAHLKPEYTFENYAVSGSNQMAYAAAMAVSKKPGTAYNPLFIYGGVGVGKTHLMQAIGHVVVNNGDVALFCTGEEFTNDLVEGIRNKSTEKVRSKYRKVKLLMIDDVQFIAGKASVQEEFFHTFNSIQREGGQIVMTSDRPPAEIAKLEERLRSRFGAGMIVDVGPADFELRTAILLIKAQQRHFNLPMESAQLVATHIDGVRELEGFLVRLVTQSELTGESAQETAEKLLKIPMSSGPRKVITPAEVITFVGNYYGVGIQQLKGDRRTKTLVIPRQILMHLLRNDLRLSLDEVGRLLGGRDHSTVMHGDEKIKSTIKSDPQLQQQLQEIKQKLLISS